MSTSQLDHELVKQLSEEERGMSLRLALERAQGALSKLQQQSQLGRHDSTVSY